MHCKWVCVKWPNHKSSNISRFCKFSFMQLIKPTIAGKKSNIQELCAYSKWHRTGKACFGTARVLSPSALSLCPAAADHRHTNWPWFSLLCFKCTRLCMLHVSPLFPHRLFRPLPKWSAATGSWWAHANTEVLICGLFRLTISLSSIQKDEQGSLGRAFFYYVFIIDVDDLQVNYTFSDNAVCFHKIHWRATLYEEREYA